MLDLFLEPDLAWGNRIDGALEVIKVQGGHSSMLQESFLKALADQISKNFDADVQKMDSPNTMVG